MRLSQINPTAARLELRATLVESINRRLSAAVAALKSREPTDMGDRGIDLDQLAVVITGLKVLANTEYRDVITKDDVGINPRDSKELFKLLDKVPDKASIELDPKELGVFKSLAALAPKLLADQRAEMAKLVSKDEGERKSAVSRLASLALKVETLYHTTHTNATKAASAKPKAQANLQLAHA